jgi:uncharacterized protein YecT (DUF1311 family)
MSSQSRIFALFAAVFAFGFVAPCAFADQDTITKAIEKRCQQCMDKDGSTAGMTECNEKEYNEWDAELNKNYNALMKILDNKQKAALKTSQLEWLKFRDLEFATSLAIYEKMDGTMYIPMSVASRTRVVRDRAIQLLNYYRLMREEDPPAVPVKKKK